MAFTPSRRVVTRSPHRRVGHVSCPWFQEDQVDWESLFEKGFIHIALLCPGLVELRFQPFKLELPIGLHYTPDFPLHVVELLNEKSLLPATTLVRGSYPCKETSNAPLNAFKELLPVEQEWGVIH